MHPFTAGVLAAGLSLTSPALVSCAQAQTNTQTNPQTDAQAGMQVMTLNRLDELLRADLDEIEGNNGRWRFTIGERQVLILADDSRDRMRVFSPVVPTSELSNQQVQAMLAANFHTALDARYAVTDGAVVALYVHPLSTLQETNLRSALRQVVSLAETFGSSYTSSELTFGFEQQPDPNVNQI